MSNSETPNGVTRRALIKVVPALVIEGTLASIGLTSSDRQRSPDRRFATEGTRWIRNDDGSIVTQVGNHIHLRVIIKLHETNRAGLNAIDLTISPYKVPPSAAFSKGESIPDKTFNPNGGSPILALQKVNVVNGQIVLEGDNPRVEITDSSNNKNLSDNEIEVRFDIPLDQPSDTGTPQPRIPVGLPADGIPLALRIDLHGRLENREIEQLNVARGTPFVRT